MCNRYRAASVVRIRDAFGFTQIESGPPLQDRYKITGSGPLQPGPFVRAGRDDLDVGQWGLTPDDSPDLRPINQRTGRPLSTNNARFGKTQPEAWTFKGPWARGQRCLVPAEDYDEPYWGTGKNIWWRFARADGQPWMIAGLWNAWTDPATGEVMPSFTMLTINCDVHPLLKLMHKPERDKDTGEILPAHLQDKRTVVPLERAAWDTWLHGTPAQAAALIQLPALELYSHGAAEPEKQVELPVEAAGGAAG